MASVKPAPVRPVLDQLLAERAAPWHVRRPLARAVAETIAKRRPYLLTRAIEYVMLRTTDLPRTRRRKRDPMSGKVISETPEQTAAYEQARGAATQNGTVTPEQAELAERKAARAHQAETKRAQWLESSGFAAVLERAAALLEDLPRAHEEHQRAQTTLRDLATFVALAAEAPEDALLQRFARRAQDLAKTIATPPLLFANAESLRALIAKVKGADLEGVNGARNPNLTAAWTRQFRELLSPLPQPGHAAECVRQVKALLAEARGAREGRA